MRLNFKLRFRLMLSALLMALVSLSVLIIYLIDLGAYPLTSGILVLILIALVNLILYVSEKGFRISEQFFSAARSGEFSQKLGADTFSASLYESFNALSQHLQSDRLKHESENNFLKALIRQAPVAIFSFDDMGRISLYNLAASKLFGLSAPSRLSDLDAGYSGLHDKLRQLESGGRCLFKFQKDGIEQRLIVALTRSLLENKQQYLVTIENIDRELMDAEYLAWRNLISVLTHEVMNSVTPIVSLSVTCRDILVQENLLALPKDELHSELSDAIQAMNTIADRSEGIMNFVGSYRKLSLVPKPIPSYIDIHTFFNGHAYLQKAQCEQHGIRFKTECVPHSLRVHADKQQLDQIFLNLIKNSIEALEGGLAKEICLKAEQRANSTVLIIQDNGCGIADEALEQIFVPFFTTKRQGSGIGMALTRQIMHAHGGKISVNSRVNDFTRVELIF